MPSNNKKSKKKKKKVKYKLKPSIYKSSKKVKKKLKPSLHLKRKSQRLKSKRIYKLKRQAIIERKRLKRKKKKAVKITKKELFRKYKKSIRISKKKAKKIKHKREVAKRKAIRKEKTRVRRIEKKSLLSIKLAERKQKRLVKKFHKRKVEVESKKEKKFYKELKRKEKKKKELDYKKSRKEKKAKRVRKIAERKKRVGIVLPAKKPLLEKFIPRSTGLSRREKEGIYFDILSRREPEREKLPFNKKLIHKLMEDEDLEIPHFMKQQLKKQAKQDLSYTVIHLEYDIDIIMEDDTVRENWGHKTQVYNNPYDAVAEINNHIKNIEDSPRIKKAELINYKIVYHTQLDFES